MEECLTSDYISVKISIYLHLSILRCASAHWHISISIFFCTFIENTCTNAYWLMISPVVYVRVWPWVLVRVCEYILFLFHHLLWVRLLSACTHGYCWMFIDCVCVFFNARARTLKCVKIYPWKPINKICVSIDAAVITNPLFSGRDASLNWYRSDVNWCSISVGVTQDTSILLCADWNL